MKLNRWPGSTDSGSNARAREFLSNARLVVLLCAIYFAVDYILNRFFSDGWTVIWPLNGVNIAILLISPRKKWLWILLGIEAGTFLGQMLENTSVWMEIYQRGLSVIEVVLGALVLPPFSTIEKWFQSHRIFSRFVTALLVGPGVSGVLAALLFHYAQGQEFWRAFNNWATCDAVGIAATLPVSLTLHSKEMRALFAGRALPRTAAILCLAYGVGALIFSVSQYPTILFCLYPMLLLVDALLGFAGSAVAAFGICMIALYCTSHSLGPFGNWPRDFQLSRDLGLQLYFGFHMIALFPASILSMERRRLTAELYQTNSRLAALASLDGLTGIANRRSFDERLEEEWSRALRTRTPLACAILDLDFFKQFNDRYGHQAGDRCLVTVAQALAGGVRRPQDLVARYGGEEFVILLPSASVEGAEQVLEQARRSIHALNIDHEDSSWKRVTVSIGLASLVPTRANERGDLVKLADSTLYLAKSGGRNRVETVASLEKLEAADVTATAKLRVLRMLGRGGHRASETLGAEEQSSRS